MGRRSTPFYPHDESQNNRCGGPWRTRGTRLAARSL